MKFTRDTTAGRYMIQSYRAGEVIINALPGDEGRDEEGRLALRHSFIVTGERLLREWPVRDLSGLNSTMLQPLGELPLEVLLLGPGHQLRFPYAEQLAALVSLGIGYEVMDSAAACRTYNVLVSEGRSVGAAIIVEDSGS
jgi:uncharacterized protein